jgi:exodeoxyribonuclease VII large subunit
MTQTPSPAPGSNTPEFSVGELARALKRTVEEAYGAVRVRGEISQPKRHSSGHLYLRLKDESAVIEAVCWRGVAQKLGMVPEDGMEVVCTGRLTTYPGRSQYQLIIDSMTLAGQGALLKLLEDRKRRLAAEGLFDPARKRKLPFLPAVIGVITSPTGAVIRDILHRLADRFPRPVLLWPVAVQGEQAAAQIAAAIAGFNSLAPGGPVPRPELLIVARGGGSLEDLMAFNEEAVVRAAAASAIPLISAVGHETDTTLIDFAADLRAPTPTAAAELAVPVRAELVSQLLDLERRQGSALARLLAERRTRIEGLARGLGDPQALIGERAQRLDDRAERLALALAGFLERRRTRLAQLGAALPHPRTVIAQARGRLESEHRALGLGLRQTMQASHNRLERMADRLGAGPLRARCGEQRQRLTELARRLERSRLRLIEEPAARLAGAARLLDGLSYKGVLARGFVLVTDGGHHPLTSAVEATPGRAVCLTFHDGTAAALIAEPGGGPPPRKRTEPKTRPLAPPGPVQGSLF